MRTLLALLLFVTPALGQDLLVTKFQPARVSVHDGTTGDLLNGTFIDVDALVGLGGATSLLWEAIVPGNGEIWVTNYTLQTIHRFTDDGLTYLGDFAMSPGRALGVAIASNTVWVCDENGPIVSYDDTTLALTGSTPSPGVPYDTHVFQNEVLVTLISGTIERLDPTSGAFVGTFGAPGGFLEQMAETATGNLLVAKFVPAEVHELDPSGNLLLTYSIPGVGWMNGVAELGNGQLLTSGGNGTYRFDPNTGASTLVDSGGTGGYIAFDMPAGPGGLGQNYCGPAVPNSTSQPGVIHATGSNVVATNDVTLVAGQLPPNQFGYFLNSMTQAFVFPVPNSQGALCLGGQVGRYNAQVLNSGAMGNFMLQIDLANTPTPSGTTAILAGQSWNFTCWYRDGNPQPTSNFTDGLNIVFQ